MDLELIDPDLRKRMRFVPSAPFHRRRMLPLIRALTNAASRSKLPAGIELEVHQVGTAAVRVLRPAGRSSDAAILWIHGGGFLIGSARMDDQRLARYANEFGVVAVSVEHRLAPEHPFPGPLDDCLAAWDWLQAAAAGLGIDPSRVVVGGESAGGGLTACLVQRIHDRDGTQPIAQVLIYPMLDDRTAARTELDDVNHRLWNNRANRAGWTAYLGREPGAAEVADYAVGARRDDLSGLPPAWIGVGDVDLFYAEDREYAQRLDAAGVPCEYVVAPMAPHGFPGIAPSARVSIDFEHRIDQFLEHHLRSVT